MTFYMLGAFQTLFSLTDLLLPKEESLCCFPVSNKVRIQIKTWEKIIPWTT